MNNLFKSSLAAALCLLATPAFAKGGTPQNHHCWKDGASQPTLTHKQCTAAGGEWKKDAAAGAAAAPAASPAPATK